MTNSQHDPPDKGDAKRTAGTETSNQDEKAVTKSKKRQLSAFETSSSDILLEISDFLNAADSATVVSASKALKNPVINIVFLKRFLNLKTATRFPGLTPTQYYQKLLNDPKNLEEFKKIIEGYALNASRVQNEAKELARVNQALSFLFQSENIPTIISCLVYTICFGSSARCDFLSTSLALGLPEVPIPNINNFLEAFGIKIKNVKNETLLSQCLTGNWRGTFTALLERKDVAPNKKNGRDESLLSLAVRQEDTYFANLLIKRKDTDVNQIATAHRLGIKGTPGSILLLDMYTARRHAMDSDFTGIYCMTINVNLMEILNLILKRDPEYTFSCPEGVTKSQWEHCLQSETPFIDEEKERAKYDDIVRDFQIGNNDIDIAFNQLNILFSRYLKEITDNKKLFQVITGWLGTINPQARAKPGFTYSPEQALRDLEAMLDNASIKFKKIDSTKIKDKKFKELNKFYKVLIYAYHHIPYLTAPKLAVKAPATPSVSDKKPGASQQQPPVASTTPSGADADADAKPKALPQHSPKASSTPSGADTKPDASGGRNTTGSANENEIPEGSIKLNIEKIVAVLKEEKTNLDSAIERLKSVGQKDKLITSLTTVKKLIEALTLSPSIKSSDELNNLQSALLEAKRWAGPFAGNDVQSKNILANIERAVENLNSQLQNMTATASIANPK